jgi:imidazolonepropionase-like amidohydrolase
MILATLLLAQAVTAQQPIPVETDAMRKPSIVTNGNCLIRGGYIITVTKDVIADGDILVKNGKIAAIGQHLSVPAGVAVIDAHGKIVTPGIIDAHSHMAAASSVNEYTDAVVPEVRIADILDPDSSSFYYKLASGYTSALVLHGSSNPIGGQSQVIKMKWKHPVQDLLFPGAFRIVKFALGENVTQANDSNNPTRFPSTRMGVEATYRRAFEDAKDYRATWDRYNSHPSGAPPRRDLRLETLSDILQGKIVVHCHSYRQDEMLMLARLSQEYGFHLVFTHSLEAYKIAPELAKMGIMASSFADAWSYKMEVQDAIPYNAAICSQAGMIMSINTDTSDGMTPVNMDAAKTMRFGDVPPSEAIKFVTINAAKQLGIDKMTGSLEVGKDADIAIWDGNPLSVYSRCDMTLVDGELMFQHRDTFGLDASSKRVEEVGVSKGTDLPIASEGKTIAIVGGDVYPITEAPIMGGTVIIRDGKIVAVGKDVQVPSDAVVEHADGMRVFPGFIDAESQIGRQEFDSLRSTQDTSELGRFQPDLVALDTVNPDSEHIPITRLGGITTTVERPLGNPIAGQGSVTNLAGWNAIDMGVLPKAALYINFPSGPESLPDFVRQSLSPDDLQKQKDFAAQQRDKIRDYLEMAKRYLLARKEDPNNTQVDSRLDALAPYLSGEKPVVIAASTATSIKQAIQLAEDLHLKMILSGGKEAWRVASFLAEKKIPVVLEPACVNALGAENNTASRDYDPYDSYLSQPALLNRAGVQFAFGSGESATSYELPLRAGLSCAYGLPEDVALKALTINAAQIFGVDDRMGSLTAGKMANVVVMDGDPLEISTKVRGLFIAGKQLPLESKWTRLYEKYRKRTTTSAAQ